MYIVLAFNLGFYCTHWKNTFIRSADKKIKRIRQDHNLLYRFISALPARVIRWIDLTRSNSEVLILYSKKSKNSVHYCSLLGLTFQLVSCNMTNRMTNRIKYLFASLSLKGLTLSLMYENKFTYWIKYFLSIFWFFKHRCSRLHRIQGILEVPAEWNCRQTRQGSMCMQLLLIVVFVVVLVYRVQS